MRNVKSGGCRKKQEKELHRQQIQKEYGTDLTGGDWYDDVA